MDEHTKGQWEESYDQVISGEEVICVMNWENDKQVGNQTLIASAPELLEACKEFIKYKTEAENDECYSLNCGIHQNNINKATLNMQQAIQKAEGI